MTTDRRRRLDTRLGIYVLIALITCLAGLLLIVGTRAKHGVVGPAIGTSLFAGGIAALISTVVRYFDTRELIAEQEKILAAGDEVRVDLAATAQLVTEFSRQNLASTEVLRRVERSIVSKNAGSEFGVERHPRRYVSQLISEASPGTAIQVMALSLEAFVNDQLQELSGKRGISLEVMVQDPRGEVFSEVCRSEARDLSTSIRDVRAAIGRLADASQAGVLKVDIFLFPLFPTVTITRVGDVMLVRSRLLRDAVRTSEGTFQQYFANQRSFAVYTQYLEDVRSESARLELTPAGIARFLEETAALI